MPFDMFSMRYGFPGANCHTVAYHSFEGIVFDPDSIWWMTTQSSRFPARVDQVAPNGTP